MTNNQGIAQPPIQLNLNLESFMPELLKEDINISESFMFDTEATDPAKIKVGDSGKTFSDLKPNGKAVINEERTEVYSTGEYVDREVDVEVIRIEEGKIYVKPKNGTNNG